MFRLAFDRYFILCFIVNVFLVSSIAQNVRFSKYNTNNGLTDNIASSILQDKKGFIWIATEDGLNRFDGLTFKGYRANTLNGNSLLSPNVFRIYNDSKNRIWIVYRSLSVLSMFDPSMEKFTHFYPNLGNPEGLTNGNVLDIFEDSNHNIWIATGYGLNLYNEDGTFKRFLKSEKEATISDNRLFGLYEDKAGIIWISNYSGYEYYNPHKKEFGRLESIRFDTLTNQYFSNHEIKPVLFCDSDNHLWFSVSHYLYRTEQPVNDQPQSYTFKQYDIQNIDVLDNLPRFVRSLEETSDKSLWISTPYGLARLKSKDRETGFITNYFTEKEYYNKASINTLGPLVKDPNGDIWFYGALGHNSLGLIQYNASNDRFVEYRNVPFDAYSICPGELGLIFIDRSGCLWVSVLNRGLNVLDLNRKKFNIFFSIPGSHQALNNSDVYAFYETSDGKLMVGTGNGLSLIDMKSNKVETLTKDNSNIGGQIVGEISAGDGFYWIGYYDYKISKYYPRDKRFVNYEHRPSDPNDFVGWSVRDIYTDKEGFVWFANTTHTLIRQNKNGTFTPFYIEVDGNRVLENFGHIIFEDSKSNLWIGTGKTGLVKFDRRKEKYSEFYMNEPNNPHSIPSNEVRSIIEDEFGFLWVGTSMGLAQFDPLTQKFKRYTVEDGLPNNLIRDMIEDKNGNIWLSTNFGLSKFTPSTQTFRNYTYKDGLQGNQFNSGSSYMDSKGRIYFGGPNGFTFFYPDSIRDNPFGPHTLVTELFAFNKPVMPNEEVSGRVMLKKSIVDTDEIKIFHGQNDFAFELTGLYYPNPEAVVFYYKMDGYDKEWKTTTTNNRKVAYSNLPFGEYNFRVKSMSSDNVYSDNEINIRVLVIPPWWKTIWFRTAIFLLLILSFFVLNFLRTIQIRQRNATLTRIIKARTAEVNKQKKELEKKNAVLTKQKIEIEKQSEELLLSREKILNQRDELQKHRDVLLKKNELLEAQKTEIKMMAEELHNSDLLKIRFFMNISHELRTPLTLIIAPLYKMITKRELSWEKDRDTLQLLYRNAQTLLNLVNQILDIRKIDEGKMKLQTTYADVVDFMNNIWLGFRLKAKEKELRYTFNKNIDKQLIWFDPYKLDKIISNFLSNAIKFTPQNGHVCVDVSIKQSNEIKQVVKSEWPFPKLPEGFVVIKVADTGCGIKSEDLSQIFNRFYQGEAYGQSVSGTGIGLAYAAELAKLHYGMIDVESTVGFGSTFYLYLPLGETHLLPDQKISFEIADYFGSSGDTRAISLSENKVNDETLIDDRKKCVLFVEDNKDLQLFLKKEFGTLYNVYQAYDGLEGKQLALDLIPDIIISDIMMPGLGGLELCRFLKNDERTSHIPVILLTAKSTEEDMVSGLITGADDYVNKPFNLDVLGLRIRNIFNNRERFLRQFSNIKEIEPEKLASNSLDEKFLKKAIAYVEENMASSGFGIESLASAMNMSVRQFYNKLRAVSALTPNDFIRKVQLSRAMILLKQNEYSISEIAVMVGFEHHTHFSRLFRKYYGVSPSQFLRELDKSSIGEA